jgi:pyrroloquinoline quinone (PQQ) biosynthesis protein C
MADAFSRQLLEAARPWELDRNPFLQALSRGEAGRDSIRTWACTMAAGAIRFPRVICSVLALCDDDAIRRTLLGNLLEEEGVTAFVPGQGVTVEPRKTHADMARRMARACGATDAELDATPPPASHWFSQALARGRWLGCLAFFAVGYEANVPATCRLAMTALQTHYGIDGAELVFLSEHMEADERHGIEMAELLSRIAQSDDARAEALEGARRGGLTWWWFHRAYRRPAAATA